MTTRTAMTSTLLLLVLGASVATSHNVTAGNSTEVLSGIYTDCLLKMSYSCIQRKMLTYVGGLRKRGTTRLLGDHLQLVRVDDGVAAVGDGRVEDDVTAVLDESIEHFLRSHVVRVTLPTWSTVRLMTSESDVGTAGSTLDIRLATAEEEGRGKKGGGMKGGMKMAGTMMKMVMIGKGMMIPVMMGMTKFMAMKGLMMGMMSLLMSKMMIFMKLKKGGGGGSGGGGWPMGGGGGWSGGGGGGGGGGGWPMGGGGGGGGGWPMGGGGGGWPMGGGGGGDWSGGGGGGGGD